MLTKLKKHLRSYLLNNEDKVAVAIFASATLNKEEIFTQYKEDIKSTLATLDTDKYIISIGEVKNKLIIAYVKELGYEINVLSQHYKNVLPSNYNIIKANDFIIFFIHEESSRTMNLLSYTQTLKDKTSLPVYFS